MAKRAPARRKLAAAQLFQRGSVFAVLLGLLTLAGILLVGIVRMAWQEHQINRQIERQEAQNAQQRERNRRLQGAAEFAESDVAAELAARERLGMAREGEMVLLPTVVLPAAPTPTPETTSPPLAAKGVTDETPPRERPEPNPVRWFRAFFPDSRAVP